MFDPITILRREEHRMLSSLILDGEIVDLGGGKDSQYISHIKGKFSVFSVNFDTKVNPDLYHDLEKPVPLPDKKFDHVILMNVVEHILNYTQLFQESFRLTRDGGSLVILIPFLFPVHPSPRDFRRLTDDALRNELAVVGFSKIEVVPLGSGVFASCFLAFDRLLPKPIRFVTYPFGYLASVCDFLFTKIARLTGKKYRPSDYALGYFVRAYKS